MTDIPFIKMHGAGNDYVFIDGFHAPLPGDCSQLAVRISHRNFGVGSDGLVTIVPSDSPTADVSMRMWNADGSEGHMCGNAARCVALWMELKNRVAGQCRIQATSRVVTATTQMLNQKHACGEFSVNMGQPKVASKLENFGSLDEPASGNTDPKLQFQSVCIGNPHAVILTDTLSDHRVRHVGSTIERLPQFPGGTNVEWVRVLNASEMEVRVWERGSGETLACGSGACAAVVAAISQGRCDRSRSVKVRMPGGILRVEWLETNDVLLSGPASVSFTGSLKVHA